MVIAQSCSSGRIASPHFSPGFVVRDREGVWIQGARRKPRGGVLDSTLRAFFRPNAVDMWYCGSALESG